MLKMLFAAWTIGHLDMTGAGYLLNGLGYDLGFIFIMFFTV